MTNSQQSFETAGKPGGFSCIMHRISSLLAIMFISGVSAGFADDSIVSDFGKTVSPQQTDKVRMVAETVDINLAEIIEEKGRHCRGAQVKCHFDFKNDTSGEIKATVGFPGDASETGPGWRQPLRDFTAIVHGKAQQVNIKEEITWGDVKDPPYGYKRWYVWEMAFPSKKTTKVDNSYSYCLNSNSGYSELFINYELATGANWSGKIGEAVITVKYADAKDLEERVISIQPAGWTRKGDQIIWNLKNIEPGSTDNILIREKNLAPTISHYTGPLLFKPQSQGPKEEEPG